MTFYEKIEQKKTRIPERFDLRYSQILDLVRNTSGNFEMIHAAFVLGYMQGIRAERAGKAGDLDE